MGTVDELFDSYQDDQSFCSFDEHDEDDQELLMERAQNIVEANQIKEVLIEEASE